MAVNPNVLKETPTLKMTHTPLIKNFLITYINNNMMAPEQEELDKLDRGWLKIKTMTDILKGQLERLSNEVRYGVGNNDEYYINQLKGILELKNRIQKYEDQLVSSAISRTK
jgi:hypothetical protein